MRFRPCIDIHNGKVKQIVGSSLRDSGDEARENYVSERPAADYARLYREKDLPGGHIILLNREGSAFFEETRAQALSALAAWPGGMQIGGGVRADNAAAYLDAGASHVIVTSYVFREGIIDRERLEELRRAVGREHIVLDLSCRKTERGYVIVTDRWQKMTDTVLDGRALEDLSAYCDEFLVHAVDAEGKQEGIEEELAELLGQASPISATYAGGIRGAEDIARIREAGGGRVDFTVGSALDLFGGSLSFDEACRMADR
ncbi:MAG: phosphoribosylformimino-5-aminoimidazole carboxamide ribotide isomerase [Lachnospiraceae bacterium]|nr:phosphoribosylformimino-5-aminoimidazole carboxamide ribotide isomerase [Lachnospiraceae bacterium]